MFVSKESEFDRLVEALLAEINAFCQGDVLSRERVMKKLIRSSGFKSTTRLKHLLRQKVILNNQLINKLKTREKEIAERIKEKRKVVSMDTNKARYLILASLMSFECIHEGSILYKKGIYELLEYKPRTMTNQQNLYRDKVFRKGTTENKIYEELCSEIASYCIG